MLKVLNVLEEGRYGGPQIRVLKVAKELRKQGIETVVVLPKEDSSLFTQALMDNDITFISIRLHRITKDKFHLLKYIFFFFYELLIIRSIIKEKKIDIVHSNGAYQIKGILASKMSGVKNVWHLNDTQQIPLVKKMFTFLADRFADNFICACYRAKTYYTSISRLKRIPIKIIQAPVDTEVLDKNIVEADEEISNVPGFKVVMVGNLNPNKGHDIFIQMAAELNQRCSDEVSFYIVGKKLSSQRKYYDSLTELIDRLELKNVHLLGQRRDVKNILKACDIYVCSSEYEASPIAVWEAMSMGLSVVSYDVGDLSLFFEKYKSGLMVEERTASNMADKVLQVICEDGLREKLSVNARECVQEEMDLKECVKRHKDWYELISGI